MFHIKVKILPSKIHGLGLFADQNASKGDIIYTINTKLDLTISKEEYSQLGNNEKETIKNYGYLAANDNNRHLSFDDIRFCNHSHESNITLSGNNLIATKEIKVGEEITQDYEEFEILRNNI